MATLFVVALGYALVPRESSTSAAPAAKLPAVAAENEEGEGRERDEWFYAQRAYPGAEVPPGVYQRAAARARQLRLTRAAAAPGDPLTWRAIGPRPIATLAYATHADPSAEFNQTYPYGGKPPYAGRVSAIATHPTDSNVVYIGGAHGGVWKTVNGGTTWSPVFDSAPTLAVGAIALDRAAPDTLYVGTGEANFQSFNARTPYLSAGLFRTTNGGASWSKLNDPDVNFDPCYFTDLVVKPGASNTILAAVHGTAFRTIDPTACDAGIYRSTDGGANWAKVTTGLPTAGIPADLAVDPAASATWYATWTGQGVYKSTDSGASWAVANNGLPATGCPGASCKLGRIALAIAPGSNPQRLYAVVENLQTESLLDIFTSADGAGSWSDSPLHPGADADGLDLFCHDQCNFDLVAAVAPDNPAIFYAGGVRLYRYTGFGNSFGGGPIGYGDTVTPNSIHVDFHALAFDAAGRLWIGSDGGVYRRETSGNITNLNATLGMVQVYPGISGKANERLVAGAQDNGGLQYDGTSWTGVTGADGGPAAAHPIDRNVSWATTQFLQIFRSTDGGTTVHWAGPMCGEAWLSGPECFPPEQTLFIAPFVMHPNPARSWLYAGGAGAVWRSTTGGRPWNQVSPVFTGRVSAIAVSPAHQDTIFVGTDQAELKVTTTGGSTDPSDWTTGTGLPNRWITDIAVHGTSADEAYLSVSGFGTGHVFRTTNRGATWTDISGVGGGRLPDSPVNAIALDRRAAPAIIYAGTDVGVFSSRDGGTNWALDSVGLPAALVLDLLVDRSSNMLVAATHGRGVFVADLPSDVAAPVNDGFTAAQTIAGTAGEVTGTTNRGATTEAMEPKHAGNSGGASVWYRWTAPGAGSVRIDTQGSSFDTLLGVYTGDDLSGLRTVASNDDESAGDVTSEVRFAAVAGQTYRIAVDGYNHGADAAEGAVNLHWSFTPAAPDTTPPETAIDSGPAATTTAADATFTFSASEPASFQCSLDLGAFAACNSPTSYGGLGLGVHSFRVLASDSAGNADQTPAEWTWTITGIAPPAACADGGDNDGDGLADWPADPGCSSAADGDEFNAPPAQCADGRDNDDDGLVDLTDPGCDGPADGDETNPRRPAATKCKVPRLKGKTLGSARTALRRAHCTLGSVTRAYSQTIPKGRVIRQSRRPGLQLPDKARVNVVVSRGRRGGRR